MKHELTAKRLQVALRNADLSAQELSNKSGVAKSSISQYVNGSHKPSNISSGKMAAVLNVNALWLMGFDVPMKESIQNASVSSVKGVQIKVLGRVAAGIPIAAITDIIDTEEISEKLARTGEFFGLQIHGDSMEPRMYEGDVVIVRQQDDAESGDIVIAMINGDDATCKRLTKYAGGIGLVSLNTKYEPMMFSNQEILEKPVKIIGKVVELRGKL